MNKQLKKKKDGTVSLGIEWTHVYGPGSGFTWNPLAGCMHGCRWTMPDGKVAICYAEAVAENVAQSAYPEGFEHQYWKPELLDKPRKRQQPAGIFVGSMTDVFGHWQKSEHIEAVIQVARDCPQHTFQFLTKNPVRAAQFDLPENCWIGASTPPDFMWGKQLSMNQKVRLMETTMNALGAVKAKGNTVWLSAEPLSWDITPELVHSYVTPDWVVIGAASDGPKYYDPPKWAFKNLHHFLLVLGIPMFYKGNIRPFTEKHGYPWREDFPRV